MKIVITESQFIRLKESTPKGMILSNSEIMDKLKDYIENGEVIVTELLGNFALEVKSPVYFRKPGDNKNIKSFLKRQKFVPDNQGLYIRFQTKDGRYVKFTEYAIDRSLN